jgi:hypothetical protein
MTTRTTLCLSAWLTAVFGGFLASIAFAQADIFPTSRACMPGESWAIETPTGDDYRDEFNSSVQEKKNVALSMASSIRGFSEALALRKASQSPGEKLFAEYWISRSLFGLGLPHIAYSGFLAIAMKNPDLASMPIHAAALDCLLRIHLQHPSISFPTKALSSLKLELDPLVPEKIRKQTQEIAWDVATAGVQALVSDDRTTEAQVQALLSILDGGGAYESLAKALWSAKRNQHFKTIEALTLYFSQKTPQSLNRYQDTARILLARAHYSVGEFDRASDDLKMVSRQSNDLADSLEELAWTSLMQEHYPEAIGTAMNLEAGGLRHTFAPEAQMVSAMAMNELCQYPDAVREISIYRKNYEKVYQWLQNWGALESDHSDKLYQQAVQFIHRKGEVPDRIAGEWIRAPHFIASQDEINTLFDEKDALPKVAQSAATEQRVLATQILKDARELKPKLKIAKMKLKAGEELPSSMKEALTSLRKKVTHWRRLQLAAPLWVSVSNRFRGTIAPAQQSLIARIDTDIKTRNLRMLTQLEEITENIQLIEVEIYNGASQDIIWQNAHPDYKQVAKAIREDHDASARSKVWDWGRSLASSDENSEIWEDELGSFKANLFDNCSSKDKYLAIRIKKQGH